MTYSISSLAPGQIRGKHELQVRKGESLGDTGGQEHLLPCPFLLPVMGTQTQDHKQNRAEKPGQQGPEAICWLVHQSVLVTPSLCASHGVTEPPPSSTHRSLSACNSGLGNGFFPSNLRRTLSAVSHRHRVETGRARAVRCTTRRRVSLG